MSQKIDLKQLEAGSVLSEISHYVYKAEKNQQVILEHVGSGETIYLTPSYVENFLVSADQYTTEVFVGKEDKYWTRVKLLEYKKKHTNLPEESLPRIGDLEIKGIRSIWEEIHNGTVFQVVFKKRDEPLSKVEYRRRLAAQNEKAVAQILSTQAKKKGVAKEATRLIKEIQENPILDYVPGEERILTGYKLQFTSRDGKYDVFDMEKKEIRQVNINTIVHLTYKGVKYTVK